MRKVADEIIISTLFGLDVDRKQCSTCKNVRYVTEFYVKTKGGLRAQCIDCWAHFKGRSRINCEELDNA